MIKCKNIFAPLILLLALSCQSNERGELQPNIIVFLVDDMGLMDCSVPFILNTDSEPIEYPQNDIYRTPNLERLAAQGVRFTQFYAHSVCSPSRATILTGQNSARHRTTNWILSERNNKTPYGPEDWNWEGLTDHSLTLPLLLRENGYKTIHVGKAHFGPTNYPGEDPTNLGFDVNIAGSSIGQPGSYYGMDGFGHIAGNEKRAVDDLEAYHNKDIFLTEALTEEAISEINKAIAKNKPFFLHMSHYAVHTPFQVDSQFVHNYDSVALNKEQIAFATLIEGIDASLGSLVEHIEVLGLSDNTIVLFLGDNGSDAPLTNRNDYSSSAPLKGKKGSCWEGGMRIPFVASWLSSNPANKHQNDFPIAQGSIQKQMGTIQDLFPTICDMTGIRIPKDHIVDGYSLKDQLEAEKNEERDEIFMNHFPHQHLGGSYFTSVVAHPWKLIYRYPIDAPVRYELYNLASDPFETTDLSAQNASRLTTMLSLMVEKLHDTKALMPEKDGQRLEIEFP